MKKISISKKTKKAIVGISAVLAAAAVITAVCAAVVNRNKTPDGVLAFDFVEEAKIEDFEITELSDGSYEITKYTGVSKYVKIPSDLGLDAGITGFPIVKIGKGAFADSDIKGILISEAVSAIDDEAFANCRHLETVIGPNMFSYIGNKSFFNCPKLTYVYFPILSSVGDSAFEGDKSLTRIYLSVVIDSIGKDAFKNTSLTNIASDNETCVPDFCKENGITLETFASLDNETQKLYQGFAP